MQPVSVGRPIEGARPQSVAFLFDREGVCHGLRANRRHYILGDPHQLVGRSVHETLTPHLAAAVVSIVRKVLTTGYPSTFSYTVESPLAPGRIRHRAAIVSRYCRQLVLWDAIDWTDLEIFPHVIAEMSDTERAVWELTAQGKTAKEIAAQIGISARSVARHRKASRERFGRYVPPSVKFPYSS